MRPKPFAVALALSTIPVLAASQEPKKSDKDNKTIVVTGCVDGGYLHVHEVDTVGSYTEQYRLAGSKALLEEIGSRHSWHLLEITGRVVDARGTDHRGESVQVGKKTRIYTGTKDIPQVPTADTTSTLQVTSYQELSESCKGKI